MDETPDESKLYTPAQLTKKINEQAEILNKRLEAAGKPPEFTRVSLTSIRKYIRRGLLVPDYAGSDMVDVPVFDVEAVRYYLGNLADQFDGWDFTLNQLASKVGISDNTVRKHYRQGKIKPVRIEQEVQARVFFKREEAMQRWYSPEFATALKLMRPETPEERAKRKRTLAPKPKRDWSRYNKLHIDVLDATPKAIKAGYVLKKDRTVEASPEQIAAEAIRLRGQGVASEEPTETVTAEQVDALLSEQENRIGPTNYRFLSKGVRQVREDGASFAAQKRFIEEFMADLNAEADEYTGEEDEDIGHETSDE